MLIQTIKGLLDDSILVKKTITEEIPCGWSDATEYLLDGEMVRRDANIRVKEGVLTEAFAGSLVNLSVKDFIASEYQKILQEFSNVIGENVKMRFPELEGMALSFQLPGFRLDIKVQPEETTEAYKVHQEYKKRLKELAEKGTGE